MSIDANQLTTPWDTSANWTLATSSTSWTTQGGDYATPPAATNASVTDTPGQWAYWYPTALVQGWVNHSIANDGLLLKETSELTTAPVFCFVSSESANTSAIPVLNVTYTLPPPTPPAGGVPAPTGTPQDGQTLTANTGSWTGDPPITYAYQWQDCPAAGGTCTNIPGATSSTYALTSSDVGSKIDVIVTATNPGGSTPATSAPTGIVQAVKPSNTGGSNAPTISGTTQDGQTLTASNGTWSGSAPLSYSYQWEDCDANGNNCVSITGATNSTYTLGASNVGSTIRVVVTASNAGMPGGGTSSATSGATGVVQAVKPSNSGGSNSPSISGNSQDGQTLTASTGTWSGSTPLSYSYQWERCDASGANCLSIASATSSSYTLTSSDVGSTVRVIVTASNASLAGGGSSSATSAQTSVVTPDATTILQQPAVQDGVCTAQQLGDTPPAPTPQQPVCQATAPTLNTVHNTAAPVAQLTGDAACTAQQLGSNPPAPGPGQPVCQATAPTLNTVHNTVAPVTGDAACTVQQLGSNPPAPSPGQPICQATGPTLNTIHNTVASVLGPIFHQLATDLGPVVQTVGSTLAPVLQTVRSTISPITQPIFSTVQSILTTLSGLENPASPPCGSSFNPYDYTPTALQACGVSTSPLSAVTPLPGGGDRYDYTSSSGEVDSLYVPPPNFHPLAATDAELAEYAFPDRPSDLASRIVWDSEMAGVRVLPPPPFLADVSGLTADAAGVQDRTAYNKNWSGYAVKTGQGVTRHVEVDYVEPAAVRCQGGGEEGIWAGIGDFNSFVGQLGQDGTADLVPGLKHHQAWYQVLPLKPGSSPHALNISIPAGHHALASVSWDNSSGTYRGWVEDTTTHEASPGWSKTTGSTGYNGQSAEAIAERPGGVPLPKLANFGAVAFTHAWYNAGIHFNKPGLDLWAIRLTSDGTPSGTPLAKPGPIEAKGAFTDRWQNCS